MRRLSLFVFAFFGVSAAFAQFTPQPESKIVHPKETPFGIVFTNRTTDALYLRNNGTVEELLRSPGCGQYYTLSPDGSVIGFKLIGTDGLQSPALFDLATRSMTILHPPVRQAGQVSFSTTGALAYTIANDVYIQYGAAVEKYSIGSYANIVALSPDGQSFCYNNADDQLFVFDRESKTSVRISGESGSYCLPLWSPAGNAVCYSGLDASLYVRSLDQQKTYSLGKGYDPAWSNDGRWIVAERRETEHHTLINSDLYRISPDGKYVEPLTDTKNIFETSACYTQSNTLLFTSHTGTSVYAMDQQRKTNVVAVIAEDKIVPLPNNQSSSLQKISSPAVYFDMPYTNQVYDTPDWYNGHWACGPTSSIMVIAYFGILPAWNVWCSPSGSSPGHYSAYGNYVCDKYRFKGIDYYATAKDPNDHDSWGGFGYMWSGGSPYSRMVNYYNQHGISASRADSSASFFSLVTAEVSAGYPYTVCNGLTTAGHIIVLNGIGSEAHTFIVNDPYGNKGTGQYPSVNGKGVQYDWPGYNNGHSNLNRIYWGVSVRYAPPAVPDSIVDDLQFTKGFMMSNTSPASMNSWKDMNQGYNGHMWYVKTKKSDTCFAQWRPTIPVDGNYRVSAFISISNAQSARYAIYHKNGMDPVIINQKTVKDAWTELGTFPFAKGNTGYVRLGDASDSTGQEIVFDALQFSFLSPLSVHHAVDLIPDKVILEQNYPNPFNPETTISFSVPDDGSRMDVSLRVFDALGREAATLVHDRLTAGTYSVQFNGSSLSSGMYLYRLSVGNTVVAKRMVLMK